MLDKTAETETRDGPALFTGLSFELDEIVMGMNVLNAKVRDLNGCFEHKQEVSAKVAADDIAKVSSQVSILAAHMASKIAEHVNRKPRV